MGTVPLLEKWADPRNLATLATAVLFGALGVTALTAESKKKRIALTMVIIFHLRSHVYHLYLLFYIFKAYINKIKSRK